MEIEEPNYNINDNIDEKLEYLQDIFYETIYKDILLGNYINTEDLEETLNYFIEKEEYEKCIVLKKILNERH